MSRASAGPLSANPVSSVPKRVTACLGCRELKWRCRRQEETLGLGCERCVAVGRECVIPTTARRTRRRTRTGTVAALERKIDALAACLEDSRRTADLLGEKTGVPDPPAAVQRPISVLSLATPAKEPLRPEGNPFSFWMSRPSRNHELVQTDVVQRGLISVVEAEAVLQHFQELMLPHFPIVSSHPAMSLPELRWTKPTLMLAILASTSFILGPEVQRSLVSEIMHAYADRIVIRGEKNLELVQAMLITATWAYPPDHYQEVMIYQLIHMAVSMAADLGYSQEKLLCGTRLPTGLALDVSPAAGLSPSLSETQRAWLGCFFFSSLASMVLRRPALLRWTPYMDRCLESLRHSSAGTISDEVFCEWVHGQHMADEIGQQFFMNDPCAKVDVSDTSTQLLLRGFEQQLQRWRTHISPEVHRESPTLDGSVHTIDLYLHEVVLHVGHNIQDFTPPFMHEKSISPAETSTTCYPTPIQRQSIAICIGSVHKILDNFLNFSVETRCNIPAFNFGRTVYAVVVLLKIHLRLIRAPNNSFSFIGTDVLKTATYLDQLTACLQATIQTGRSKMSSIFFIVLGMLKAWFQRQCQGLAGRSDEEHPSTVPTAASTTDEPDIPNANARRFEQSADWAAQWSEADFATLFDSDDGSFFESALGQLGGLTPF